MALTKLYGVIRLQTTNRAHSRLQTVNLHKSCKPCIMIAHVQPVLSAMCNHSHSCCLTQALQLCRHCSAQIMSHTNVIADSKLMTSVID